MTPERWQKVGELFDAALRLAPARRAGFLAEACADDEGLRREVESLLLHDAGADFPPGAALGEAARALAGAGAGSLVGRDLGAYKIVSLLGAGGMGEVYLAEDGRLGRRVALKLLPVSLSDDSGRLRRFEQEARAASSLNHPNILTVHEIGREDGTRFIATEYVEGETLRQKMARSRLSLREACDLSVQIASALVAAHRAGVVHRDVKPENVMVREDGIVKVLDFGLAKLAERQTRASAPEAATGVEVNTEPGVVMGTVGYMSPEQARGLAVDERTDVWSLGVVLYEMVTGRQPFEGETPTDVIISIVGREPEPLAGSAPEAPTRLERIVKKALAKGRAERYQTAGEMLDDLKGLWRELDIEAEVGRYRQSSPSGGPAATMSNRRLTTARLFPRGLRRSRVLLLPALAAALIIAAAVSARWIRQSLAPGPQTEIRSLAVLPLDNLSGDPSQDYFADGITEALITDLAKIGGLRVISRTSAMHYKGTKKPLPEIARELRVDAVVEGTVQRSGDRVRVNAQLIHAADDRHLWVETYERDVRDVLGLQSEIARTVAREVRVKVTPAEEARLIPRRTLNRKALDDYLRGRYLFWNRRTEANLHKAIEYFQSSISEDPTYAQAYVGLADCYIALGTVMFSSWPPTEARRRAEEAAARALELDVGLAEAHNALGVVRYYNWDWAAAEREFQRAIELNPNYANAHNYYASYLMSNGRAAEAIAASDRARELDPLSLSGGAYRGFLLENARRYDEAIEQLRLVVAMDPNHYQANWYLGHTYAAAGRFDEAVAAAEKAVALSGRAPGALGILGLVYGLAGRKGEAAKILNELLELNERRYVTPPALVNVYIGLGDKDQAFAWLEKAYQERSYYMVYLKVFPMADPLRTDPRFDDLLRRVGLTS